ncbi:acyltransferase [Mariprofundus sp. EBB-1]|uniref:acyltransferase family protein n=1 Tax=Mariprofundus sp. EBB-1 TaxID=2650971 RepID=UPI00191468CE|nr:acyltransferase [Mariprofundus sp. EBB-1]
MVRHNNIRLRQNNFDLLRLLFAGVVCLVHASVLSGFQSLAWIPNILSSEIAVRSFFVLSGFLIFMSYERSSSLSSYFNKRIRRIYPAYFTVVIICAISMVTISTNTIADYFSFAWLKYLLSNLTFLNFIQHELPGVFETNKMAAVNGALWTLKIEVMFYLTVPLFVLLFRKFSLLPTLVIIYCLSIAYVELMSVMAAQTESPVYTMLGHQLPGQLSYFIAGAFFYYYLPLFERFIGYFLGFSISVLVINMFYALPFLEPFCLAAVVVFFGLFLYVGNVGKFGDFSYGVYILHFPIIQMLLYLDYFHDAPWQFLATVVFTTVIGAIALWHLIEKRFLLRKSHYVSATSSNDHNVPNGGSA